jgi:hypothetical protein
MAMDTIQDLGRRLIQNFPSFEEGAEPEAEAEPGTVEETEEETVAETFTNMGLKVNETCMYLIVVYVLLFLYKKEVMDLVNKVLKKL